MAHFAVGSILFAAGAWFGYKSVSQSHTKIGGDSLVLYHGSKHLIQGSLEPRPSRVVDGEAKVFATTDRWLALVFIGGLGDTILGLGFVTSVGTTIGYLEEMVPGALNHLRIPGYIYTLPSGPFHSDHRLGMKRHELVSDSSVPILSTERIADVYDELMRAQTRENFTIVKYEDRDAFWAAHGGPS